MRQAIRESMVGLALLALTASAAHAAVDESKIAEMDALARSGDHAAAVAGYAKILESAPEDGVTSDEFEIIVASYCGAARGLADKTIAEAGAAASPPEARVARIVEVRALLARCPTELPTIVRLGDTLEVAATAGWEATVTPMEAAGDLLGAWATAGSWLQNLEAERALWKRYEALTERVRAQFEAAAQKAGPTHPWSTWFFGTLTSRAGAANSVAALTAAPWAYTVVKSESVAEPQIPALCAGFAPGLAPTATAGGPNPATVKATITSCQTTNADIRDTGYETRQVMGPVAETSEECRTESVPTLVTATQTSCNQYGQNCYSYLVGSYVGVPRTICHPVTIMVEKLHDEQVPYQGTRPGLTLTVNYTVTTELNGKTLTKEASAVSTQKGDRVVPDGAPAEDLNRARPSPDAVATIARQGIASEVEALVREAVFTQMAYAREQTAVGLAAAGDLDGAREIRLEIAHGPSTYASGVAWATLARELRVAVETLRAVISGEISRRSGIVLPVTPWVYDPSRINIESAAAVIRFGVPPVSTRAALHFAAFDPIDSQPDRRAVFTSAFGSISPTLFLRKDGFGPGIHDDLEFGVMIGVRVSDAYKYPGAPAVGEEEESRLAGAYMASYTALLGWRGHAFGFFAGARAQYAGLRVGDARQAGNALPLVGRLEIRFADDKPLIAQGWAYDVSAFDESPPRSLGASLELPLQPNVALWARFERRNLETQFGGLDKDDLVSAGKRIVTLGGLGVSLSIR